MKTAILKELKIELLEAIDGAMKLIHESAESYALTKVGIDLGILKDEEKEMALDQIDILIIQGKLARRTVEALEKTLEEIDEILEEADETEEDENEFEVDAETMAEVLKLFSR